MSKLIDLTGKTFGRLTVLERQKSKEAPNGTKIAMWKCVCECGNYIICSSQSLRTGKTKSCGCFQKEFAKNHAKEINSNKELENLKGRRFGKLTVLEQMEERSKYGSVLWMCRCDCGKNVIRPTKNLLGSKNHSCGCSKETRKPENLTGLKFGRLNVIGKSGERTKRGFEIYKCKCDCGNVLEVPSECLRSGNVVSCGCKQKENLENARKIFQENEMVENTSLCMLTAKKRSDNKSGRKGVYWEERTQSWRAEIGIQGRKIKLGRFRDFEKAVIAREEAEEKYFRPMLEKYGRNLETTSQ